MNTDSVKKYVSRGGIKLEGAIRHWSLDIRNYVVLDVGSSTGGFVDCLLQNGATKVYSVDTCYGELAWKLRNDPRVVVLERTNILHLEKLSEKAESPERSRRVDLVTIDASWTKLELILPAIRKFLKPEGIILALLKPQYEAARGELQKGVVKKELLSTIVERVEGRLKDLGFNIQEIIESPILGVGGNKEYFLLITT